jgi:hypothetical protein
MKRGLKPPLQQDRAEVIDRRSRKGFKACDTLRKNSPNFESVCSK